MSDKLKACPFCEGRSYLAHEESRILGVRVLYPSCLNTECTGFVIEPPVAWPTERQAIAAWNTRADSTLRAENAELQKACETHFRHAENMFGELSTLRAENERLRNLLCLSDELLMQAWGAFPLPGNPNREPMNLIRVVTGADYHVRNVAARKALAQAKL